MDADPSIRNIVYSSVDDGLMSARHVKNVATIQKAIQFESSREVPRVALIRGLKTILRKLLREGLDDPKDAA